MTRTCSLFLHFGLWTAAVAVCLAAESPGPKPDQDGWIALFDGTNLDAWQKTAAGKWKIVDGVLTNDKRAGNLWTKDNFGDFIVDLEVKCVKNTNSGVFLRGPVRGWHGLEIQVLHTFGDRKPDKHDMGAMYDCVAPSVAAEKPLGQWNHMVIRYVGNSLKVTLNDKPIIDADVNQWTTAGQNPDGSVNKFEWALKDLPKTGHIGLQDYGVPVWYRNIRIKPLGADKPLSADKPTRKEAGFESLFDGQTLQGWHASAQTGHSRKSGNKSGGRWVVEQGAIVGSQDIPGNGGILITDEQFGDYEVVLEMNNDFGPDSGLFLRTDEMGTCYQAMIDYHGGGNLMGLYGEGRLGAKPHVRNFSFLDRPDRIVLVTENKGVPVPVPFPMPLEDWPKFWRHGQWNELRARIVGNPPHITTWIKDVKFMDWTETERRHPDKGGIGLQLHGGGDFTKQFVRYRNIRLKRLDDPKSPK